jgi:hypothetical protein
MSPDSSTDLVRMPLAIFFMSIISIFTNIPIVSVTDPAGFMPASLAGHMVATSTLRDSDAALLVRACFGLCFNVFGRFCFGYGVGSGNLRLGMLIFCLVANFVFLFFTCLSAVPDFVAFDTGLLSASWAGHERFCFWVASASTAAVWVSTLSIVVAVFHVHSPLEDVRIVAFEVCSGRHVLQVVVVEDAMTCLHRTADAVPADRVDLHVDVMLDAGLANGDLS